MNLFAKLRSTALKQSEENDFPSWLIADVITIASNPERYANYSDLVEELITQIKNYDSYAGAGCFDISVSAETIGATIHRIML